MNKNKIHKILMYSQLNTGKQNVRWPCLRFKDKLKTILQLLTFPTQYSKRDGSGEVDVKMVSRSKKWIRLTGYKTQDEAIISHISNHVLQSTKLIQLVNLYTNHLQDLNVSPGINT